MTEIEIRVERGIAPPPRAPRVRLPDEIKKTVWGMEVGESFSLPDGTHVKRVINFARGRGLRVQTQRQMDGRVRVWRID